jgi:endoglucanase Acf2
MSVKKIIYDSGNAFFPKSVNTFLNTYIVGDKKSTFYVTYWSIVHFINGILCGFIISKFFITKNNEKTTGHPQMNNYYIKALVVHTIWELWQVFIENTNILTKRGIVDTMVDTLFFMLGAFLYKSVFDK